MKIPFYVLAILSGIVALACFPFYPGSTVWGVGFLLFIQGAMAFSGLLCLAFIRELGR